MQQKASYLENLTGWELKQLMEESSRKLDLPLDVYHERLQLILDEMNRRGRLVAKKYKKRHYDFQLRDFSQRYYEGKNG